MRYCICKRSIAGFAFMRGLLPKGRAQRFFRWRLITTDKERIDMKKYVLLTVLAALVLMLVSNGIAMAEIIPPYGMGQIGYHGAVLCQELTVRKAPNTSSKAVKTLKCGDFILVIEQEDGWAYLTQSDAEDEDPVGWVNAEYIVVDPAWYRTEGSTPVYAWDDTSAPKVALLGADKTLPILRNEGDWLLVSLRGAVGWIHCRGAR